MLRIFGLVLACSFLVLQAARADGPADNNPATVRRVPKLGIEVPADRRAKLEAQLQLLEKSIERLRNLGKQAHPRMPELLPDVEVYYKAVHDAIAYQEFFDPKEIDFADQALTTGLERADKLSAGEAPWTTATGLVVRGYVSKIDGSVQPYGLVVPESYTNKGPGRFRCDLWFHGRGETLSELAFVRDRTNNLGQFTPEDTLVLHPYGRYSNAFKFAGEIDVLEALDSVKRRYRVDEDRISARGFSMGGAAAWQFAVHYSDRWFAANPGAGFSETPEFLRVFQQEKLEPTWWERRLWHWYDCPDWCLNLRQCPTVAYSGELDSQKQAADIMQAALAEKGIDLSHIIGPQTKHAIHPQSKIEIENRMQTLSRSGREWQPLDVDLTTYTLRYNRMQWLTVDGLEEHWTRGHITATLLSGEIDVEADGVTDFTLDFPAGECPLDIQSPVILVVGEQELEAPAPKSDRSWQASLHKVRGEWRLGKRPGEELRKKPGLQGPIDDALMDSFLFVRPTGTAWHSQIGSWAQAEMERAVEHWRRHFRGVARVKDDTAVTPEDIASSNLVLWGDPASNAVLKQVAEKLPIRWTEQQIVAGEEKFSAAGHALIAVYPNPLNPSRYVVLNSSFTFRDYAYLNNARQVPMLPDWAVVDLSTPPGTVWPGKIAAADFFDERWQLKVSPERAARSLK
jgi:dienelactone hydrolase